ncbi:hypothetical protein M413DRAFT_158712 [Hebeloma cylindrosporum]|uniref:Uncharacterized protein n=1 Tax=Hebeloma cylindrosporum TaxID=76867 RepID=A0A0C2YJ38_HEBCY|nr:hypothetical protein M413DRAFT_158712 [Hebeloma cylindrosporum h7]
MMCHRRCGFLTSTRRLSFFARFQGNPNENEIPTNGVIECVIQLYNYSNIQGLHIDFGDLRFRHRNPSSCPSGQPRPYVTSPVFIYGGAAPLHMLCTYFCRIVSNRLHKRSVDAHFPTMGKGTKRNVNGALL